MRRMIIEHKHSSSQANSVGFKHLHELSKVEICRSSKYFIVELVLFLL